MGKATGFGKALPKSFRKAKPGFDQAFTLPKGTSAAPIKQSKVTGIKQSFGEGSVIVGDAVGGWELGKKTSRNKYQEATAFNGIEGVKKWLIKNLI